MHLYSERLYLNLLINKSTTLQILVNKTCILTFGIIY